MQGAKLGGEIYGKFYLADAPKIAGAETLPITLLRDPTAYSSSIKPVKNGEVEITDTTTGYQVIAVRIDEWMNLSRLEEMAECTKTLIEAEQEGREAMLELRAKKEKAIAAKLAKEPQTVKSIGSK
jgi:hypothetical protein